MKYVFIQVFSPFLFCLLLFLHNNLFTCPAFLLLVFFYCFVSLFRFLTPNTSCHTTLRIHLPLYLY